MIIRNIINTDEDGNENMTLTLESDWGIIIGFCTMTSFKKIL